MKQKQTSGQPAAPEGPKRKTAPELPVALAKEWGIEHRTAGQSGTKQHGDAEEAPVLADPKTEAAVDEIVAREGDELLAAEDAARAPAPERRGFWGKIGHFFSAWWYNRWARNLTVLGLLLVVATVFAIPDSRYFMLNTAGVRSKASVVVLDNTTQLPLKNVTVTLGDMRVQTDKQGTAAFAKVRLGKQKLTIKRLAFAPQEKEVVIGWGSNPLGKFTLQPTGAQYMLEIVDYFSGKPVEGAEANSDGLAALSDKQGKIVLTIDETDVVELPVQVSAPGYRAEQLTLKLTDGPPPRQALVPAYRSLFISKQSGKYDLFSVDLDGKNRHLVLAGTGHENNNITLGVSTDGTRAALVSTREGSRSADGFLLSTLTLVTVADGATLTIDKGEQIRLIDWIGSRVIYQITTAGASAANSQRHRLISYDFKTNSRVQLANANLFNSVRSARGMIYYAVSNTDPAAKAGFFAIRPDGTNKQTVLDSEVWSMVRSDYNTLQLQTPESWYTYSLNGSARPARTTAPADLTSRAYVDDAQEKYSVWLDERDGQNNLLVRTLESGKEAILRSQTDMGYPLRWAPHGVVVYRVSSGEIADYATSIHGGEAKKVIDVTHTYGFTYSE